MISSDVVRRILSQKGWDFVNFVNAPGLDWGYVLLELCLAIGM